MVSFEVLFRNIETTILNTLENEPIKLKLLDTAFSLFDAIKKNKTKSNLSETELGALNYLISNKDIIIEKAHTCYYC